MPVKQVQPACQVCGSTSKLFNCGKCSTVQYCSGTHETEDSKRHSSQCSRIWARLHAIQQCEELPLDDILAEDSHISSLIPVDNMDPVFHTQGAVWQVDRSLRNSLIGICIKQNTYASMKLATEQIRMIARYRIASPLVFVPVFLKTGADGICYNLLSIERRIAAHGKDQDNDTAELKQFYREAKNVVEREAVGCDVFEDLRQWIFWSPMPVPTLMAALVLVLQVWIVDLENLLRFDRTIATYLRGKLNYDTVEVIRGYLFDSEAMNGNRKVARDRDGQLLQELKEHQDYVLKASYYSCREFWDQVILGVTSGVIWGNIRTSRETGAIVGFPSVTWYTVEDLAVFRRLLQDDTSTFRFVSDFFEKKPFCLQGPPGGLDWVRVWREVSRLTTARSDALQDGGLP